MTIEFHCPECGKLLRTTDDKAGVSAPCSGCGAQVTVPFPERAAVDIAGADPGEYALEQSAASVLEKQASQEPSATCPMCGAAVPVRSFHCPACGESLVSEREIATGQPTRVGAGDMVRRTWLIFASNLGITVGGVGVAFLAQQALAWPVAQATNNAGVPLVARLLLVFVLMVAGMYFQNGLIILMVKIARGQKGHFRDLFAGARFVWRTLLATMLFGLLLIPAMFLLLVPAVLLMLMFWPVSHVIVVEDRPVLSAFGRARELTQGNMLSVFLLGLALSAVQLPAFIGTALLQIVSPELGNVVQFAWIILTMPFILLLLAVMYIAMCGRPTAEQLSSTRSAS